MNILRTVRAALRDLPPRLRVQWTALVPLLVATTSLELAAAGVVYVLAARASAGKLTAALIAAAAAVFLARSLFLWFAAALQAGVTARSMSAVFATLLRGTLAAPYDRRDTAGVVQRMTVAIDTTYRLVMTSAAGLVTEALVVTALTVLLIVKAPLAAAIAAALLSIATMVLLTVSRKSVTRWGREVYDGNQQTIHELHEILGGLREIKTGQDEERFASRATAVQTRYADALRKHLLAIAMPRIATETGFVAIALAMVAILAAGTARAEVLPLLALFAYVGFRLIPAANRTIYHLDHIRHGEHAVAELSAALREVAPFAIPDRPRRDFAFRDAIVLDDVSFAYGSVPALAHVSLTIRKGEWIGLAGENGAGKSTLLDIVAGLRQPSNGSIRIDGRPLDRWLATSPPLVGYVPQRPFLFDGEANASGGERQRVAIARAVGGAPEILLFDEPTTAIDAETEAHFMRMVAELKGRTTAIIVSHRMPTLDWCDRVVHLQRGAIVPAPPPRSHESDRERSRARTSTSV